ncbi:phospholipase D family protein [Shewanella gaetbuli]
MLSQQILIVFMRYMLLMSLALLTLSGCASKNVYPTAPLEYQLAKPTDTPLANYLNALPQIDTQTGVYPLGDGVDAFVARLAFIESAKVSIDLQYYLFHDDETGKILTLYLYRAAQRGVRVRLLLDDMATKGKDSVLSKLVQHPNISVRIFNPDNERTFRTLSFVQNFSRLNHRMHNKSFTVDNLISVVGGRNIGDEYYSANEDVEFGDLDVLLVGEVVPEVSLQFDLYWNSSQVRPIEQLYPLEGEDSVQINRANEQFFADYETVVANHPYVYRLIKSTLLQDIVSHQIDWNWGDAELMYDPPNKLKNIDQPYLLNQLNTFFSETQDEILIISPYFVPTEAGVTALVNAVHSGIKVTVITNSLAATDVLAVHAGYMNYRQQLVEGGVTLYEVKASPTRNNKGKASQWRGSSRSSLHAKVFVIDNKSIFVGSFNFDPRSAWLNTEMGVVVEQPQFAQTFASVIKQSLTNKVYQVVIKDGDIQWLDLQTQQYITQEPDSSWWQRFMANTLSWLPIESQL